MTARFLSSISDIRGSLLGAESRGLRVEAWEREINVLICEVYDLTEEEAPIVEGRRDRE